MKKLQHICFGVWLAISLAFLFDTFIIQWQWWAFIPTLIAAPFVYRK